MANYLKEDKSLIILQIKKYFTDFVYKNRIINERRTTFTSKYITDIHGVAEFILMYSLFEKYSNTSTLKIIFKNILTMKDGKTFLYRKILFLKIKIYFPRWTQAVMLNSISSLLINKKDD